MIQQYACNISTYIALFQALRNLMVLVLLLSCSLAWHHVMEAIITDYTCTCVHNQRQRLLIEHTDAAKNKSLNRRHPKRLWINLGHTSL